MTDETKRILKMVANGKITVNEGERLLAALRAGGAESAEAPKAANRPAPRYLMLEGMGIGKDGENEGFRMRLPLNLLRAGMKMRALIPEAKRNMINEKLRQKGIEGDVFNMSEEQIDAFVQSLSELEFEAGDSEGGVRIFLE